jgi:hypothetical protein
MRIHSTTRYAALAAFVGALACAGNPRTDETAAARDTASDTLGGDVQNPPGYRGMERDTTIAPQAEQTPTDTFLQQQGQGQPQDTAGYSGMERAPAYPDTGYVRDTTGAAGVRDTSGAAPTDTTQNPSSVNPSGLDTSGTSRTGDTTGYNPSQESRDSSAR